MSIQCALSGFLPHHRPRGAFNIPREGPVLFICGPHANQFLDPLLLFSETRKEAGRRVSVLTAAKVCLVCSQLHSRSEHSRTSADLDGLSRV